MCQHILFTTKWGNSLISPAMKTNFGNPSTYSKYSWEVKRIRIQKLNLLVFFFKTLSVCTPGWPQTQDLSALGALWPAWPTPSLPQSLGVGTSNLHVGKFPFWSLTLFPKPTQDCTLSENSSAMVYWKQKSNQPCLPWVNIMKPVCASGLLSRYTARWIEELFQWEPSSSFWNGWRPFSDYDIFQLSNVVVKILWYEAPNSKSWLSNYIAFASSLF